MKTKFVPNHPVLIAVLTRLVSSVSAIAQHQTTAKLESAKSSGRAFARSWHISLPRPIMVAAWERLMISHNLMGGNAQDAVVLGGSDCRVFNNIFYWDRQGGVFLFRRGCRNNTIINNIIIEPTAFRFDAAGSDAPADQPQGNALDYNCIVGGSSVTSCFNPMGAHNIKTQPGFVDAARLDFHLLPGSPCIDAGDLKVMEHFYGQAPDIGLYETK